jgi:hypothetical protein
LLPPNREPVSQLIGGPKIRAQVIWLGPQSLAQLHRIECRESYALRAKRVLPFLKRVNKRWRRKFASNRKHKLLGLAHPLMFGKGVNHLFDVAAGETGVPFHLPDLVRAVLVPYQEVDALLSMARLAIGPCRFDRSGSLREAMAETLEILPG